MKCAAGVGKHVVSTLLMFSIFLFVLPLLMHGWLSVSVQQTAMKEMTFCVYQAGCQAMLTHSCTLEVTPYTEQLYLLSWSFVC